MRAQQLHLTDRFTRAVDYARTLHIERRKGTAIPYMAHLMGVAALVMSEAGHVQFPVTEDMVIAALLHDAVEDHGGEPRLADIEANFGPIVAKMVEGLSDSVSENPDNKGEWTGRKTLYLEHLRNESREVQLISAADKLHNARAIVEDYRVIGAEVWKRFKRGRKDQIEYFGKLLEIFKKSGSNRIVSELERVVTELKGLSANELADNLSSSIAPGSETA